MNYENMLKDLIEKDDRIMVMTAENRSMLRNIPSHIPDNFVDVGIMEQTLVAAATGFALRGRIPIAHALACFITLRAFEFARTDIGAPNLPVKLVGSFAGFQSTANGFTHQAIDDIGVMSSIPNMNIFCPADSDELLNGMPEIINSANPFYIRYNDSPSIMNHFEKFEIGKAEKLKNGNDVSLISYGLMLNEAYKSAEFLENQGYSVDLINVRTIKPLDIETVLESILKSKLALIIEDHLQFGSLFHQISLILTIKRIQANIFGYNLKDRFFKPAMLQDILEFEKFRAEDISEFVINELNK